MGEKIVAVPTMKGMTDSLQDLGKGALGGAILALGISLFGGLGFLIAPVVAAAMVKGNTGSVIATIAGVGLGMALLGGLGGGGNGDSGTM